LPPELIKAALSGFIPGGALPVGGGGGGPLGKAGIGSEPHVDDESPPHVDVGVAPQAGGPEGAGGGTPP